MTGLLLFFCFCVCFSFGFHLTYVPCKTETTVHIVGMSGHGKSFLTHNLTGDPRAISGGKETTNQVRNFLSPGGFVIYDYPGFGTPQFEISKWIEKYQSKYNTPSSIVILVIGSRIYEQHQTFLKSLTNIKRLIVFRSQTDIFPITKNEFMEYWDKQSPYKDADQIYLNRTEIMKDIMEHLLEEKKNENQEICALVYGSVSK